MPTPRTLVLVTLYFATARAGAAELPIVNPSFEQLSRPLAVAEITNGAGGTGVPVGTRANFFQGPQYDNPVIVDGWRTLLPPPNNPNAIIRAGVMHPPMVGQNQPYLTGYSGTNVAMLQNAYMQQTLPVFVEPNTHYRLSFLAGFGVGASAEGVYMSLLAVPDLVTPYFRNTPGAQLLAQTQGLHFPQNTEGLMLPYSLEFTTPVTLPQSLQSQYLAITFIGSDGLPISNYDDFKLTATPIPASPTALAPAILLFASIRRVRGRYDS